MYRFSPVIVVQGSAGLEFGSGLKGLDQTFFLCPSLSNQTFPINLLFYFVLLYTVCLCYVPKCLAVNGNVSTYNSLEIKT